MATRTGTPLMPSVLLPVAAALAATAANRKPQAASRSRGRQICFQGRRATQTFKAETFVREIDCPGGSAGHVPPTGHRKQVTAPCSLAGRVCVHTRSDETCHISSLAWWVSPEWHELGNTLPICSPLLLLLITSAGVHGPAKTKARGFGQRTRRAYISPSLSRGGRWERGGSTSCPNLMWVVLSTHSCLPITNSCRNIATRRGP